MTTLLIQGLAAFMLLLFGAMALLPLLTSGGSHAAPETDVHEDRVLHVSPVPMIERLRPLADQPTPLGKVDREEDPARPTAA